MPFVNNHDTFRPQVNSQGNYTGWNTGSELAAHIEPNDPRNSAAHAIILAVDGAPQIFFEDLFDIGYNGNRFSHQPTNATELPVRSDIENLIVPPTPSFQRRSLFGEMVAPDAWLWSVRVKRLLR